MIRSNHVKQESDSPLHIHNIKIKQDWSCNLSSHHQNVKRKLKGM